MPDSPATALRTTPPPADGDGDAHAAPHADGDANAAHPTHGDAHAAPHADGDLGAAPHADAGVHAALHADAVATLRRWEPTGPEAAEARDRTLALLAAGPVAMGRAHRPGHVTASALVLDATGSRVLLCLHGKFRKWVQLGGHCEPADRTLAGAALREAAEESGIAGLRIDPVPIDVDIHPVRCQGGSLHYDVRFAVLAPPGAAERVSDESEALGWFPPDRLPEPLAGGTARLVTPALATLRRAPLRPAP